MLKKYGAISIVVVLVIVIIFFITNLFSYKNLVVITNSSSAISYSQDGKPDFINIENGDNLRLKKGSELILRLTGDNNNSYSLIEISGDTPDTIELQPTPIKASSRATLEKPLKSPIKTDNFFYGISANTGALGFSREDTTIFPEFGQLFSGLPPLKKVSWISQFSFYFLTLQGTVGHYSLSNDQLIDTLAFGEITDISSATPDGKIFASTGAGVIQIQNDKIIGTGKSRQLDSLEITGQNVISVERDGETSIVYRQSLTNLDEEKAVFRTEQEIVDIFGNNEAEFIVTESNIYSIIGDDVVDSYFFENYQDYTTDGSNFFLLSDSGVWNFDTSTKTITMLSRTQAPFVSLSDSIIYDKGTLFWGSEAVEGVDYIGQDQSQYSFRSLLLN